MSYMFHGASSFNQDISTLNTSNVNNMSYMFKNATAFNNVSVSGNSDPPHLNWDTSKVTDMRHMFANATSFNKDLSSFNVNLVTNMSNMFQNATNYKFTISIDAYQSRWIPKSVITYGLSLMFSGVDMNTPNSAINQDNYNNLLIYWGSSSDVPSGKEFNAGTSKYSLSNSAAVNGRNILISKGWTIIDGGGI